MAGFCIEVRRDGGVPTRSLRLVDVSQRTFLGAFKPTASLLPGSIPQESRHYWVRRAPDHVLFIEGAPGPTAARR